jgi:hypothetical protein
MNAASTPVCWRLTTGSSEANANVVAGAAGVGSTDATEALGIVLAPPPHAARYRLAAASTAAAWRRGSAGRGRIGALGLL